MIPVATTSTGTLKDTLGNCLPITVTGTYFNGVVVHDTNYVQITVNVATTGSYNIQSDRQNGFQFAGTGVFSGTGVQTVSLRASGTPLQIQSTNFTVTFDSASCSFSVNVLDSTGHSGGVTDSSSIGLNQWQFVANGHTYAGNITTADFSNLIGADLTLAGNMASNSADTAFGITIQFPGSTLDTGSFATSAPGTNFSLQLNQSGNIIFAANATSNQVLNIDISSYSGTSKIVVGTFSGSAYDINGNTVPITNGEFKATVQ